MCLQKGNFAQLGTDPYFTSNGFRCPPVQILFGHKMEKWKFYKVIMSLIFKTKDFALTEGKQGQF